MNKVGNRCERKRHLRINRKGITTDNVTVSICPVQGNPSNHPWISVGSTNKSAKAPPPKSLEKIETVRSGLQVFAIGKLGICILALIGWIKIRS